MRATLSDVADLAGVSATTVSAVIRGRGKELRISETTRARIWEAVRELGYRPLRAARSLRSGRHETVGYLCAAAGGRGRLLDSTDAEYMRGIAGRLRQENMRVVLLLMEDVLLDSTQAAHEYLLSQRFDGLIVEGEQEREDEIENAVAALGVPVVWLNGERGQGRHCVRRDEEEAGRLAVEHLAALDHRRIAFLAPDDSAAGASENARQRGYAQAMGRARLSPRVFGPVDGWGQQQWTYFQERPAAIVAHNMTLAWQARRALAHAGLAVPKDVSLVSCNDGIEAVRDLVGISAASRDRVAMGGRAAGMLLAAIAGNDDPEVVFHPRLIDRGSTQPAPTRPPDEAPGT